MLCLFWSIQFYCKGRWDGNVIVFSEKWSKLVSFNYTEHFVHNEFISLNQSFMQKIPGWAARKYVLVVLHIDCTATVQKIKFLYMSLEEP